MDTIRLRDRDLADLLEASARCVDGCGCGTEQVEAVLDAVAALVHCDVTLRNRFHVRLDVEGETGMVLTHDPDGAVVVVLSRGSGDPFDECDRLLLMLLRPHLDAALRGVLHPRPQVSPRQLEVLRLVRDGLTNAQVARRLGIAEATVAKHLEHVYSRTGARSRTHAVALCAELLGDG